MDRQTDGHTEGQRDGWKDRQMDGWMDGRMDGPTDGQTDGWTDGRTDGKRRTDMGHAFLEKREFKQIQVDSSQFKSSKFVTFRNYCPDVGLVFHAILFIL